MDILAKKERAIREMIGSSGKVAVAYSGGISSTILLRLADSLLGSKAIGITVVSPLHSTYSTVEGKRVAREIGARHKIVELDKKIIEDISHNSKFRYYFYMRAVLSEIKKAAGKGGFGTVLLGDTYNKDHDHKGLIKAASEFGCIIPFNQAGIEQGDLKMLAKMCDLDIVNDSESGFLASKIPYGTKITERLLDKLDNVQTILTAIGIHHSRHHLADEDTLVLEVGRKDFTYAIDNSISLKKNINKLFSNFVVRIDESGGHQ